MARNNNGSNHNGGYDLSDAFNRSRPSHSRRRSSANFDRYSTGRVGSRSRYSTHSAASSHHHEAKATVEDYSRDAAANRYHARNTGGFNVGGSGGGKGKKVGLVIVGVLVAVLVIAGIAGAVWYHNVTSKMKGKDIETTAPAEGEPYYVLLLGGDSRGDEATEDDAGNRTDSIMVARVDEQEKSVHILSIPRDLRVKIPGKGYYKINAAYSFGEIQGTVDAVEDVLGIDIAYYAIIYFDGFETLVDKLGGVTVEVPEGTYYAGVSVPAGDAVTINGKEALVLARCRHGNPPDQGAYASGDYQRTLNQRNLIKAIAKGVLSQDVTKYPALISGLAECVETNMSVDQMIDLAKAMKGMDTENMDSAQLPTAGASIDGEWFCAVYQDVYEVLIENFRNGRDIMYGMDRFSVWCINDDMTSSVEDGAHYAFTYYEPKYGPFLSETTESSDDSSGEGSSDSGSGSGN